LGVGIDIKVASSGSIGPKVLSVDSRDCLIWVVVTALLAFKTVNKGVATGVWVDIEEEASSGSMGPKVRSSGSTAACALDASA
jgi:hypothetical protein